LLALPVGVLATDLAAQPAATAGGHQGQGKDGQERGAGEGTGRGHSRVSWGPPGRVRRSVGKLTPVRLPSACRTGPWPRPAPGAAATVATAAGAGHGRCPAGPGWP